MGFWNQRSIVLGADLAVDLSREPTYPSGPPTCTYAINGTSLFYRDDLYEPRRTPHLPPSPPYLQLRPEVVAAAGPGQPLANGIWALATGDLDTGRRDLQEAASRGDTDASVRLLLALVAVADERYDDAIALLRVVVSSDQPLPDETMRTHLVRGSLEVHVTGNLTAHVPLDRGGAALLLAELLQLDGQAPDAAGLLETLGWRTHDPGLALALADLYVEQGQHAEVSRVTGRFTHNASDLSLQILLVKLRSRREAGELAVALALSEEALRFPERAPHLLRAARYERALTLELRGQVELARIEFERIFEEDPGFRDVRSRLNAPARPARGSA
jgi:thioredoxin-like negative regulator of GroEL